MAEELIQVAEEISLESEIKEIPIDKPIQDFYHHLSYNERIIFSAKFGDGKTYFLNKFFEENKDEFEAIRIFPVNYQVADNKDVFELIKKDILIHLLANDLIKNENFFDEFTFAKNYLFNNGADFILDILGSVSEIKTPVEILQKSLKQIRKFKDEKGEAKKTSVDFVEDYLGQFENGKGVAEYDVISELISRVVKSIQDKGKKVILVIDDLDRIDPTHLFRILNVLTAHIDREVVLQNEIEDGVGNNKFNFDHIITVFDYQNAKKIFYHLYGLDTDFIGYISKYVTSKIFDYSLQTTSTEFVVECLSAECGITKNIFKITNIREKIRCLSLRDKIKLISGFEKEMILCVLENKGIRFSSINTFTFFLVILKRLDIRFVNILEDLLKTDKKSIFELMDVGLCFGSSVRFSENSINIPISVGSGNFKWHNASIDKQGSFIKGINFGGSFRGVEISVLRSELKIIYDELMPYIKA